MLGQSRFRVVSGKFPNHVFNIPQTLFWHHGRDHELVATGLDVGIQRDGLGNTDKASTQKATS